MHSTRIKRHGHFTIRAVAVEVDANAPSSDPKLNSLELESALEPDLETDLGLSEPAPPLELERIKEAAAEKLEALVVEVEASEPGSETTAAVEKSKPLSQQQLAKRLKCNPTTVYRARQKPWYPVEAHSGDIGA